MVERMGYPRMHLDEGWLEIVGGTTRPHPDRLFGDDENAAADEEGGPGTGHGTNPGTNYETLI